MQNLVLVVNIEAVNSNPNGDPGAGGRPREIIDGDGRTIGHISAVSIKRKMRDVLQHVMPGEIFITSDNRMVVDDKISCDATLHASAAKKGKTALNDAAFCKKYWDVRAFGQVYANASEGGRITGCVQVGEATTHHEILINDIGITTCFQQHKNKNDSEGTMGRKSTVQYGLYNAALTISGHLAAKNSFTIRDLAVLVYATLFSYRENRSSARPAVDVVRLAVQKSGNLAKALAAHSGRSEKTNPGHFSDFSWGESADSLVLTSDTIDDLEALGAVEALVSLETMLGIFCGSAVNSKPLA